MARRQKQVGADQRSRAAADVIHVNFDDDPGRRSHPLSHQIGNRRQIAGSIAPCKTRVALQPRLISRLNIWTRVQKDIRISEATDRSSRRLPRRHVRLPAAEFEEARASSAPTDAYGYWQSRGIDRSRPEGTARTGIEHIGVIAERHRKLRAA